MTDEKEDSSELKTAFNYLYQTYFGDLQIEKDEIERLPVLLADCDLFIDVGASLGMYTYFANRTLDNAKIIAIEGDPDRFAELSKNCVKWEEEGSNSIQAVHAVVGDSSETIEFFKTGSHISGGVFILPDRADDYETVDVRQVMLDEFYEPDRQTVVKIDVEGAEYRVLLGAEKLLENDKTKFLIGIHSWGDRERRKTPMDFLRLVYSKRMDISKTTTQMTSNYIFQHTDRGRISLLISYMKYVPLLLARQLYRQFMPRSIIRLIGRKMNASRVSRISKTSD